MWLFGRECLSGACPQREARKYRTGFESVVANPRPARNWVVTAPGNISPAPEVDRSNSTERARTDCLRKRECAIPRSSRKRCLPSARHQAVLSARKLNQRERASKLTPLRSLPCASRACPSYRLVGFDTRKLNAPPVACAKTKALVAGLMRFTRRSLVIRNAQAKAIQGTNDQ